MFVFSSLSLRILYFGQRSFCKYFLSVYGLSSHSLDSVFSEQTLLILIRFSLSIIFFFYGLCLGAVFKKVIAIPMIIQIFSRYFLGYLQFCIVHLSLWSFRDNFCEECMICIQIYFFLHVDVQLSQEHLLKELFFLHCTACVPLSNIC